MINYKKTLKALETAIEIKGPDTIVDNCKYTNEDGTPSCLIGTAFAILGVERPEWDVDNRWTHDNVQRVTNLKSIKLFTPKAKILLTQAQKYQDNYKTWRDSLDLALKDVDRTYDS